MNEQFKIFDNELFGRISVTIIDDQIWFIGNDITRALGYSDYRNALYRLVDREDKMFIPFKYYGQNRKITLINESGLLSLIYSSKMPNAKKFKHWVRNIVIPPMRKIIKENK